MIRFLIKNFKTQILFMKNNFISKILYLFQKMSLFDVSLIFGTRLTSISIFILGRWNFGTLSLSFLVTFLFFFLQEILGNINEQGARFKEQDYANALELLARSEIPFNEQMWKIRRNKLSEILKEKELEGKVIK